MPGTCSCKSHHLLHSIVLLSNPIPSFETGSLIKHELVAHLGLGIALRAVLDALRKSVDSKVAQICFMLVSAYVH